MAETQQAGQPTRRHRRRRKRRALKQRILVIGAVVVFLAAWAFFVLWYQNHLARKDVPVRHYEQITPWNKEHQESVPP